MSTSKLVACIEVGGSSIQTVVFGDDELVLLDGAQQPAGARLALAVPGVLDGHRVVAASNLGWFDVDPVDALGLRGPAEVVRNDAEAAALGEAALRDWPDGVVYVGLGTGIGGAVVRGVEIVAGNLFGHDPSFGDAACRCGSRGCLETVAAGWALPARLDATDLSRAADAIAVAVDNAPASDGVGLVVIAGGMARRHPALVDLIDAALADRSVEASSAPGAAKSAAAWGLRQLVAQSEAAVAEGGRP